MINHVVCLENNPKSIEYYLPIITRYKLHPEVCARPHVLGNFCDRVRKQPKSDSIKAFVLDMHDKSVPDLAEIELPQAKTLGGLAVGFAVAEQYLRTPDSVFRQTPIVLLTGYKLPNQIENRIEKLKRGKDFFVLKKPTGLMKFEEFIQDVALDAGTIERKPLIQSSNYAKSDEKDEFLDDAREGIDIVIRMLDELNLSAAAKAASLGYTLKHSAELKSIVRRAKDHPSVDLMDRVELIIEIKSKLDAIFGTDPALQFDWLNQPQAFLDDKSPLELIEGGHQHELAHIAALLVKVTG
jgi:uncharacterized protein (DUF2384 family)